MEDRKSDGTRFSNIFEMRSYKCNFLLETMPKIAHNYALVRYEDLKKNPIEYLSSLESKYQLQRKHKDFKIETKRIITIKHDTKGTYFLTNEDPLKENYIISDEILNIINNNIDINVERKMKYLL